MRHIHWLAIVLLTMTGIASAQEHKSQDAAASKTHSTVAPAHHQNAPVHVASKVPMDAARRAGYEASVEYHKDPHSRATMDAIRRLILTADGKLPAKQRPAKKPTDDGDDRD